MLEISATKPQSHIEQINAFLGQLVRGPAAPISDCSATALHYTPKAVRTWPDSAHAILATPLEARRQGLQGPI